MVRKILRCALLAILLFCSMVQCQTDTESGTANNPVVDLTAELKALSTLTGKWQELLDKVTPLIQQYPDQEDLALFRIASLAGLRRFAELDLVALDYLNRFPNTVNRDQVLYYRATALNARGYPRTAESLLIEASRHSRDVNLKKTIGLIQKEIEKSRPSLNNRHDPEHLQKLTEARISVINWALEEYKETVGKYPDRLDQLLVGDPPYLARLPVDPRASEGSFVYEATGEGYVLKSGNEVLYRK